ncbi:MAG: VCBS repeat-containing protein, partial [Actinobacteria bacterium]|nr:VCBS repeat-containing protein [Actinomycetota bacterium]
FTEAPTSPEGADASDVAVGDFNGDGDLDLAVAHEGSNDVTILLGDGTGDFTEAPTSPEGAGEFPSDVAVGDFNGDGDLDLVVSNSGLLSGLSSITILLGDGTGDFTEAPRSPEGAGDVPIAIDVGDFNGDGSPDLAVADDFGGVIILLGDGTGDFTEAPTSPEDTGFFPNDVAVGDFNGDGNLDLAVANGGSDDVTILLGDGSGDFTEAPTSPEGAGSFPIAIAVGDFNGDGSLDLAVANVGSNDVTILLGDGTGDFTEAPGSPVAGGDSPIDIAVGDFDGDGNPDLAVANEDSSDVTILINQSPDEKFSPGREEPATAEVAPLAAELRGARRSAALGPAVHHRGVGLKVAGSVDRPWAGDAGDEAVALARTGLPLPLLALAGSLLLGAGARLRRRVRGRTD